MRNHSPRNYWLAGAFALSCLFFPIQAQAISLDFAPANQTVNVHDTVTVDIIVSGLQDGIDEAVTAFNLTVDYSALVLTATAFTFGTDLLPSFQTPPPTFSSGQVSLIVESSIANDTTLIAAQGDSVTLGTLSFQAIGIGTSPLTFSFADLTGTIFSNLSFSPPGTGNVEAVPEPSTLALMATGAMGLLAWRRWKK